MVELRHKAKIIRENQKPNEQRIAKQKMRAIGKVRQIREIFEPPDDTIPLATLMDMPCAF